LFTAADPAALTDDVPAGDTPNALATFERDAADGTPAGLVDATFVTATELHVAFSEAVTGGAPAGWSLSGGLSVDSVAAGESPDTVALTVSPPAVEGTGYTLTAAPGTVTDGAGNTAAYEREGIMYQDTVTFTATTERLDHTEHIRIEFSDDVTGTTVAGEWFVGAEADGTGGTAASILARVCATSALQSASIDVAQVCGGDTERRAFYIEQDGLGSGETPRVAYRAPSGAGATPIVSALNGLPVSDRGVVAADGMPPLFEAATASSTSVTVTFDEPVAYTGAGSGPDASMWRHYESSAAPPSKAELDAAAGSDFDSAALSADGRTLTLALDAAHSPTTASSWDSADTADVPDTIGYAAAQGMADIADTSPAANALADNTADAMVADGAPPEAAELTMAVLSGGTSGAEKTGEFALIAGSTDAVRVTVTLSEPSSASTPPELRMFGASQVMALSNSDETATAAIAVSAAVEAIRDGPIGFGIDAVDARSPPNAATLTQDDLTGPQARVDVSIPEIASVLVTSATRAQLDVSEEIRGTGMVTVRAQPTDAGTSAELFIRPMPSSGHVAVADLALEPGTEYTFTIETTVTDLAGNAFEARAVVPVSRARRTPARPAQTTARRRPTGGQLARSPRRSRPCWASSARGTTRRRWSSRSPSR